MILEILRLKDALELCDALHVPQQVALQYCDYHKTDIYHVLYHINLKPDSFKFLPKNKRFQIEANSDEKTRVALLTFDLEFVKNYIEEVKLDVNCALSRAAWIGFTDAVKLLLSDSRVDLSEWRNGALSNAARNGHTEVVKLLLSDSRVDPSSWVNGALRLSAWSGHTEVVKILLSDSRVNPSARNNSFLVDAARKGHTEVVKLLLSDSRLDVSGEMIQVMMRISVEIEVKKLLTEYLEKKQSKK
jgi:ankyrin repeat protein